MGPTGKAFIVQLRLTALFVRMTPYLTIKPFFGDRYTKQGPTSLPGHEALTPVNFPNLCKVANTRKRKIDGTFRDYRSTRVIIKS